MFKEVIDATEGVIHGHTQFPHCDLHTQVGQVAESTNGKYIWVPLFESRQHRLVPSNYSVAAVTCKSSNISLRDICVPETEQAFQTLTKKYNYPIKKISCLSFLNIFIHFIH